MKDVFRPRFSDFLLVSMSCSLVRLLLRFVRRLSPHNPRMDLSSGSTIGLDAGPSGWKLIEYEELYASAKEYFSDGGLVAITVTDRAKYIRQLLPIFRQRRLSHYLYDPRTGSAKTLGGLAQAFCFALLVTWYGVVPIARITDVPVRRWRFQVSVVTALSGVVVTLMDPAVIRRAFPHKRVVGPLIMPLSKSTFTMLQGLNSGDKYESPISAVLFTGSLYEPRTTYLRAVAQSLAIQGIGLQLVTRNLGEERDSNEAYWRRLVEAPVVITTAGQVDGPGIDYTDLPHLLYRYTEVLAAGSLLVAPEVSGADSFFRPGVDFVACGDADDAASRILRLLEDRDRIRQIAATGQDRLGELLAQGGFWGVIDKSLELDGFNKAGHSSM